MISSDRRVEEVKQQAVRTMSSIDQAVQVAKTTVDSASDPVFIINVPEPSVPDDSAWRRQVEQYEEQLSAVRRELNNVKLELELLSRKHTTVASEYDQNRKELTDQINEKVNKHQIKVSIIKFYI